MEEVKSWCWSVLQLHLDELHCGASAILHHPTNVDLASALVQGLYRPVPWRRFPVYRYRTTLWPHYPLRSSWWYGHPASTYSAVFSRGKLSVLLAGAGRTAGPGRRPCRDGAGACAHARIQRPSGGGKVRTRPVPASVRCRTPGCSRRPVRGWVRQPNI